MQIVIHTIQRSLVRKTLLSVLLMLSCVVVNAQDDPDIFKSKDITFLGIDFSQATFVGPILDTANSAFPSATILKEVYFKKWNDLIYEEKSKYNFREAFKKEILYYDLKYSAEQNAKADTTNMLQEHGLVGQFTPERIQQMVWGYANSKYTGPALLFVVDYFDKNLTEAAIHVVIINYNTGKVLLNERMISNPQGFGLRNYWSRPFYNILQRINLTEWAFWKSQYKSKK
jgi:hypothetical protein